GVGERQQHLVSSLVNGPAGAGQDQFSADGGPVFVADRQDRCRTLRGMRLTARDAWGGIPGAPTAGAEQLLATDAAVSARAQRIGQPLVARTISGRERRMHQQRGRREPTYGLGGGKNLWARVSAAGERGGEGWHIGNRAQPVRGAAPKAIAR